MTNPFRVEGPAVISFSGGRTSGLMLRRILDAHGGRLPCDVVVLFANTGKEREETLRFVEDCSAWWGVRIVWAEYRRHAADARHVDRFCEVDFRTASRRGEPFDALIAQREMLPRPAIRFCTEVLKIRVMRDWMLAKGVREWDRIVGLRRDEPRRVASATASGHEKGDTLCPLYDAGITEADVLAFWRAQSFDLALNPWEGNCDLCFLKSQSKRVRVMRDRPDLATWWLDHERGGREFRPGEPSYATLARVAAQPRLPIFDDPTEDALPCACTD